MAYAGGRVYFGSYDHHVYALNARTGQLVWKASAQQRLGARGTFYSTPAVAYGRVYIGSTDGKVYSFGATSGKLRWSHGTGGYVYASPAVWQRARLRRLLRRHVLLLRRRHRRRPLELQGERRRSPARAVVINGVVYFSTLQGPHVRARRRARASRSGSSGAAKYAGVVTDGKQLFLVGYARVFALAPQGRR